MLLARTGMICSIRQWRPCALSPINLSFLMCFPKVCMCMDVVTTSRIVFMESALGFEYCASLGCCWYAHTSELTWQLHSQYMKQLEYAKKNKCSLTPKISFVWQHLILIYDGGGGAERGPYFWRYPVSSSDWGDFLHELSNSWLGWVPTGWNLFFVGLGWDSPN